MTEGGSTSVSNKVSSSDGSINTKSVSFSSGSDGVRTVSSYRDYEEEAKELVKLILQQSIQTYQQDMAGTEEQARVKWPTGENFTIQKAEEAINKFVKTWPVGETWEYCIDYLHHEENLYCFAVKYSEPTRRKPVPRATASVYFYLLVHSKESPVMVLYVVEGQRLAHRPTDAVFHEVWLRNVIRNKLAVTEGLNLMAI